MAAARYNRDGLTDAHELLMRLFVQYRKDKDGREIDRVDFLNSLKYLNGESACPAKNRRYLMDRLDKLSEQSVNPRSRWTVPEFDQSAIFSTFKASPHINTILRRSQEGQEKAKEDRSRMQSSRPSRSPPPPPRSPPRSSDGHPVPSSGKS